MDSKELITLEQVTNWDGAVNTKLGKVLRDKVYGCFGNMIQRMGKELSAAINDPNIKGDKERIQVIKTLLAKHNIYSNEN